MLRAERKGKNATCHRPESRMECASSGIGCMRMALGADLGAALGTTERTLLNLKPLLNQPHQTNETCRWQRRPTATA